MKNSSQEPMYRSIEKPVEVRKSALESAKALVSILQDFQHVDELREQRVATADKLSRQIQEITQLLSDIQKMMPKIRVPAQKVKKNIVAKEGQEIELNPSTNHQSELMDELNDIEKRLKELQ